MKIKIYINFYPSSEIGTLRVKKNFMAPFSSAKSVTNSKNGLGSGGHSKNIFVLKEMEISFLFHF